MKSAQRRTRLRDKARQPAERETTPASDRPQTRPCPPTTRARSARRGGSGCRACAQCGSSCLGLGAAAAGGGTGTGTADGRRPAAVLGITPGRARAGRPHGQRRTDAELTEARASPAREHRARGRTPLLTEAASGTQGLGRASAVSTAPRTGRSSAVTMPGMRALTFLGSPALCAVTPEPRPALTAAEGSSRRVHPAKARNAAGEAARTLSRRTPEHLRGLPKWLGGCSGSLASSLAAPEG